MIPSGGGGPDNIFLISNVFHRGLTVRASLEKQLDLKGPIASQGGGGACTSISKKTFILV